MHQADILISKRFKEGKSHLIVSIDSDYLMCLGKEDLLIKKLNYDENHKRVKDAILFMASNDMAKIWHENSKKKRTME